MPVLTDEDILDLTKSVLKDLGRGKFEQIAQELQYYEAASRLLSDERMTFDGGTGMQWTVMHDTGDNARMTSLFETDAVNVQDHLTQAEAPWRYLESSYAWEKRVMFANNSPEKIVDLLKVHRASAMIAQAELFENQFWSTPASSADKKSIWGIFYWLQANATEGFNGGNPSGFSDGAGGIDSTQFERWRNWTAQYTSVSKADLIKKMRRAWRKIGFKNVVSTPGFARSGDRFRIYVNETTLSDLEDLGEAQNENIGRDLAAYDDAMVFRGTPIVWVPKLDENATHTDPVVMVNWAHYSVCVRSGEYNRETGPMMSQTQHNVMKVFMDTTVNTRCTNRRQHALITKAA